MKKLFTILLLIASQHVFSQTKLTPDQTLLLLNKTNRMYCDALGDVIRCMFEYNEEKFNAAMATFQTVIKNYDTIEKDGSLSGSSAEMSMARAKFNSTKWSVLSLRFDKDVYKNGERKKKVEYAGSSRKIPKKLKEQFDKLNELQSRVCW